ncbi:MAG: transporter substrate-binding domain-containing protein [Nitrospirae bacterium]|nr:transporter substrate-binding domain-containing protein [Nitrospirota bacterium]
MAIVLMCGFYTKPGFTAIAPDNVTTELTAEEKAFLKGRKIRLGVDSARPPYEFIDEKGVYSGMSAGFIETCAKRLGIEIVLVPGLNVGAAIKKLKEGEIDVIPKISPDPERAKDIIFTRPYSTFAAVIVTRQNVRYISGMDNLDGLKIGVLKGLIVETRIKRDYPNLPLMPQPDIRTALLELSAGRLDVLIDNMAIVSYNIDRLGLNNLKIAGQSPYHYDMAFGIRKDWPLLASALDKALAGISKQEKTAIMGKWLTVEYQPGINWRVFGPIAGALLVIIVFIIIWNRRLRTAVSQREEIQRQLKEYARELESSAAIKSQVAEISSALQKTMDFEELAHQLLSHAAPIVGAAYGALYVYGKDEGLLRQAGGGYGCVVKDKSFAIGQGLVGQCAYDKEPITVTTPSGTDIVIKWGMGEMPPNVIILLPVIQAGNVLGVIELAGMAAFSTEAMEFLDELMPIVAVNIGILNRNLHTKGLLAATQQLADELNSQKNILKETETWYRDIIESAPDGIIVVNQAGEIVLANYRADKMFGYEHGELPGINIDMLVPEAIRAQHGQKRDLFFKTKATHRLGTEKLITAVRKDGTKFQVEIGLSALREAGPRGICVCASIRELSSTGQ